MLIALAWILVSSLLAACSSPSLTPTTQSPTHIPFTGRPPNQPPSSPLPPASTSQPTEAVQPTSTILLPPLPTFPVTASPTPSPIIAYPLEQLVHAVAWSPDGQQLAVSSGKTVRLYETTSMVEITSLAPGAWAAALAFQPRLANQDGTLLALALRDGTLQLWDPKTGQQLCSLPAHARGVNSLDFSPDGSRLVSAGNDALVRLWDFTTLDNAGCNLSMQAEMIGGAFAVPAVRFSPDGKLVASVDLQAIRLRDPITQRLVATLRGEASIFNLAFSPDGAWLVAAETENTIRLWNVQTAEIWLTLSLPQPSAFIWSVALSPDGRIVAGGSSNGTVGMWDLVTGELLTTLTGHTRAVTSLAFSPDGLYLASGGLDATVRLWELPIIP